MKTDDFLADLEQVLHQAAVRRLQTAPSATSRGARPRWARVVGASLTAIAVVFATAITLVARTPTPQGPSADERPASTLTPQATPTSAGTPKPPRYSVLDGPAVQLDRRPYDAFRKDPVVRRMGLPKWSQLRVATTSLDSTVYAAPGRPGQVCLVRSSQRYGTSMGCIRPVPGHYAVTDRFGLGTRGGTIVSGLLPDGASDARIQTGSTTVPVEVVNNGFVVRIGDEDATLRWTDGNGPHVEPLAPSPAASLKPTPTTTPDRYSGRRETKALGAQAPVPGSDAVAAVVTSRSRGGSVCLIAGFLRDGRVGEYGRDGRFSPIDVGAGPGSCGDVAQNLDDMGGIALGRQINLGVPSSESLRSFIFGLVRDRTTSVTVTWRDGTQQPATVAAVPDPQRLDGAEGTFIVAAPTGIDTRGARLRLATPDGTVLHDFEF